MAPHARRCLANLKPRHLLNPKPWSVNPYPRVVVAQPSGTSAQTRAARRRDHPELTELLCVELMTRQLDAQSAAALHQQHAMLACLVPWMENISFAARWEGDPPPPPPFPPAP